MTIAGRIEVVNENGVELKVYKKFEKDAQCIHRKTNSLSLNAKNLEECDKVVINLSHLNTIVSATKKEIKEHKVVLTYNGEVKYYYPVEMWKVVKGNPEWYGKKKPVQEKKKPVGLERWC